jgi:hypothetical protein
MSHKMRGRTHQGNPYPLADEIKGLTSVRTLRHVASKAVSQDEISRERMQGDQVGLETQQDVDITPLLGDHKVA